MSQDTNDNKLGEIDSSIKLNKVQQFEGIQKKCNESKEKVRNLED